MGEDEKILEIFDELKKREETKEKSVLRKLPQKTKLYFFGVVGILLYAIYTGRIDKNNGLALLFIVGAIIYFSTYNEEGFGKILTEHECRIKLYQQLKQKQLHPFGSTYQIHPNIIIKNLPDGKLTMLEGKPRRWVLGLEFYNPSTKLNTKYAATCNAYSGDLQGMKELKGGIGDMDVEDIKVIPDYKMFAEKKYHDFMGKYWTPPK